MTDPPLLRTFLFIGSAIPDAALSQLKASGVFYTQKKLESKPENWDAIVALIRTQGLAGVVCKLTGRVFRLMVTPPYADVAPRLFGALGEVPHAVFVHEEVMTGQRPPNDEEGADDEWADETWQDYLQQHYFDPPPPETREKVVALLEASGINVYPYRTNAELSVLSSAFVEDTEKNLLFRIYVPTGRLYAAEADKLLALFRDWLSQAKKQRVRQDGYTTGHGRVYEFFGEHAERSTDLSTEFADFSRFLDRCVAAPREAVQELTTAGLDVLLSEEMVSRYGRDARRIQRDIRHSRETRMLGLRHRLEAELEDAFESPDEAREQISRMVDAFVPQVSEVMNAIEPGATIGSGTVINFNQQIVQSVEGTVIQGVQGSANFGVQAQELMKLIANWSAGDRPQLESDVHELEDNDARMADRLAARQRLKRFLFKLEGKVEDTALGILRRYIETKIGV